MAKSAKHINWLDFGIFHGTVMFIVGFSYEETIKNLRQKRERYADWILALETTKQLWDSNNWGFCSRREPEDGKIYFFVVIKERFDFKDESHAKLAHEILHLCSFNLKDFLDPMKENEAFCYTHTHLMNQCYKILRN